MTSIAKLKDRARKYEQKEDWEAAIKAYQQVLETEEGEDELELELTLYNRIGDLHLRLGHTDDAVSFYETAADKYAEAGFINNAIALCNKALRHRPDRPTVYLKLSRLCSEQGFVTDARRWILEYAERQMKAGHAEEALAGLEDFADLSDDPEIRETLAQQLVAHDRHDEAVGQLRHAFRLHTREGDDAAAERVADQARSIDPSVEFEAAAPPVEPEMSAGPAGAEESEELAGSPGGGLEGLETRTEQLSADEDAGGIQGLEGLETTAAEVEAEGPEEGGISGLELSFSEADTVAEPSEAEADTLGGLETFDGGLSEEETEDQAASEPPTAPPEADLELPEELDEAEAADGFGEFGELGEIEEADEEAEPLPLLDTGFEDEDPLNAEPGSAEAEAEEESEPLPLLDAEEEALDLGDLTGAEEGEVEPEDAGEEEAAAGSMDLDLSGFDRGMGDAAPSPQLSAETVDTDAVLERSRELVSRGLTSEALRELRVLSGTTSDAETFRAGLAVVDEVVRHDPNDLEALQRRVEYSVRAGDRELLVNAYLDLADALARLGAETKARAMYERVLDLDPENGPALEALGTQAAEEDAAIDLDAVLREVEPGEIEAGTPAGAAGDPSFAAMLSQFKAKVSEPVENDDAGDHYDLGLAFKEMGLIDEAIAEFQTALTGGTERLKVYEELGSCFVQKGQYNVAVKVLSRALQVPHGDDSDLLGVYYHLGTCYEELGQRSEAREAYQKVLSIDGSFGDVPDRMARL